MAAPEYASVAQLQDHVDTRLLAQLTSDSGSDATVDSNNTQLMAALRRASSDIESYCLRGEFYTPTDLTTFQTDGDHTLIGLVADLTLWYLYKRRGAEIPPAVDEARERAFKTLEDLKTGSRIFGSSTEAPAAGKAKAVILDANERAELGLVSDEPFFPVQRDRLI